MKFNRQEMRLKGTLMQYFLIRFNRFKILDVQSCEVDALLAPFSLDQQWVGFV
jgi:hypothetical protein